MNYLTAVIPVRKGSQRVKNKNFKKFNNQNLLIHKILKLKKINLFDEIIVNTDSTKAIKIAKSLGVSYHKRKDFFASSRCPNNKFWQHVGQTTNSKYIFFTNCTSPLIKLSTYKKAIELFEKYKKRNESLNYYLVKDFLFLTRNQLILMQIKLQIHTDIYRLDFQ